MSFLFEIAMCYSVFFLKIHLKLITLLPAGKTQLMEHDTPWRKAVFHLSRNPVG